LGAVTVFLKFTRTYITCGHIQGQGFEEMSSQGNVLEDFKIKTASDYCGK